MAKFSGDARTRVRTPIQTTPGPPTTLTHEGAPAHTRDARSDLFLLGVTNLVGEGTFYESAEVRDARFRALIHQVTVEDPAWVKAYGAWLRRSGLLRSAPIVVAAEYVAAGGPAGRSLVDAVLQRPDEPGEMLAYWHTRFGRRLPAALKRGVADACTRLFNERAALRYDGKDKTYRLGDVIRLVHPKPMNLTQGELFDYLVGQTLAEDTHHYPQLTRLASFRELQNIRVEQRREYMRAYPMATMASLGSWERLAGWLQGPMDAEAWEVAIPEMGYMALLRNLRNFDEAGISERLYEGVTSMLSDPDRVKGSRQLPFRFWSAYKATASLRWAHTLETALNLATQNVPALPGHTLVLTDTSGSMMSPISARSTVKHYEVAALFAATIARTADTCNLVSFATTSESLGAVLPHASVLRVIETVKESIGRVGMGTNLGQALTAHAASTYDRVVVFSDLQVMDKVPPLSGHVYAFNTGGYRGTPITSGPRRLEIGGFSDAAFTMMAQLESMGHGTWPWEA